MNQPSLTSASDPTPRWAVYAAAGLILLTIALAYANSLRGPFVYDDVLAIQENASIRRLSDFGRVLVPPPDTTTSGRPILNLSLAANYAVSGTNVWSYHVLNVAIHGAAALALFGLVRRTLIFIGQRRLGETSSVDERRSRIPTGGFALALTAALLWGLHPLCTEGVDYVVQRAESLMSLFLLLTLYCFTRGADGTVTAGHVPGKTVVPPRSFVGRLTLLWLPVSVLACALGMATKENMAAAPLLVLLYDRSFASGSFTAAWRRHGRYYLALAATWLLLAVLVASTGGNRNGTVGVGTGVNAFAYWLTQPAAILRYVFLSAWPNPLVFDYGTLWVAPAAALLPTLVVLGLALAIVWQLWRNSPVGFVGIAGLAILAPTSVMPGVAQMIVEHRMYLPLAGCVVLGVAGAWRLLGRRAGRLLGLVLPACLALTSLRNTVYRSELALWGDTAAKRPDNARAYFGRANGEFARGRMMAAIPLYQQALALYPDFVDARNNLGNAYSQLQRYAEALAQYRLALQIAPRSPGTNNNVGNALNGLGRPAEAERYYARAVEIDPRQREARLDLAGVLMQLGRWPEAVRQFQVAAELDPAGADAHIGLAESLVRAGRSAESFPHFEAALAIEPRNAELRAMYGNALADANRVDAALAQFRLAVAAAPDSVVVQYNYAATLLGAGRTAEAVDHFEAALRVKPDFAPAREALAQIKGR